MAATRATMQGLAEAEHLPPEVALCAGVLRQLVHDLRSPRPDIRQDAEAFLADGAKVGFWADALGLDQDYLVQGMQAALRQRGQR